MRLCECKCESCGFQWEHDSYYGLIGCCNCGAGSGQISIVPNEGVLNQQRPSPTVTVSHPIDDGIGQLSLNPTVPPKAQLEASLINLHLIKLYTNSIVKSGFLLCTETHDGVVGTSWNGE